MKIGYFFFLSGGVCCLSSRSGLCTKVSKASAHWGVGSNRAQPGQRKECEFFFFFRFKELKLFCVSDLT